MRTYSLLAFLAGVASTAAFGQNTTFQDGPFQVGYAVNLNVGDTVINLSNDGADSNVNECTSDVRVGLHPDQDCGGVLHGPSLNANAGRRSAFRAPNRQPKSLFLLPGVNPTQANICVNTYVFDPQEEEIGCCACLVTPNGLNSLSVQSDLISNNLTAVIPSSVVIKLVANTPATDSSGNFTVCNPATVDPTTLAFGMLAWGATLEPNTFGGNYSLISFPFLQGNLSTPLNSPFNGSEDELSALTQVCAFVQSDGTGYGICKSCRTGALSGDKN